MIHVSITGEDLRSLAEDAAAEVRPEMVVAVRKAQHILFNTIRLTLSRRGTGRLYRSRRARGSSLDAAGRRRDTRGRFASLFRRASAPGEPPAPDTGEYRSSIKEGGIMVRDGGVEAEVYTDSPLAPWLEYGTRTIRPRPHFRPAMEQAEPEIDRILR